MAEITLYFLEIRHCEFLPISLQKEDDQFSSFVPTLSAAMANPPERLLEKALSQNIQFNDSKAFSYG